MHETKGVNYLLGDPKIAIAAMVPPLAVALLIQTVNSMADLMWVSWLGAAAIGGLGLAYPLYATVCGVGNGLAVGASAAIARYVGLKDQDGASRSAGQSLTLSIIFSAIVSLVMVPLAIPLLGAFGDPVAGDEAVAYGMPMFALSFFLISSSVMSGILRGEGAARASMYIQVAGALTNIILDPVLIYVMDMGVAGAGWATVAAGAVSLVLGLLCYLPRNRMYVTLRIRDLWFDARLAWNILYVGLPQMAELITMSLINIPMNYIIMGVGGAAALGIYTSSWRICYVVLVPSQAYGGAVVSVCSAEYAMRRPDLIRQAFDYSVKASVKYTTYACILFALLAYPLARLFTVADDMAYLEGSMILLIIAEAIMLPVMSQVFVGSSFLQALKHSEMGFVSALIRNIVMFSSYASMAYVFGVVEAIWIIMAIVEVFGGILMWGLAKVYLDRFERSCKIGGLVQ